MKTERRSSLGFTLLEVMVAVAILGLGLTAIMSAQAGAFASSRHARNVSVATGLARCKMNELEERIMRLGLPYADEADSGMCCEGDNNTLFACTWRLDVPKLPEAKLGDLNLSASLGGDGGIGGAIGQFAQLDKGGLSLDGGIGAIAQTLSGTPGAIDPSTGTAGGAMSGLPAGGVGGLASMVMGLVYPQLKGIMEASTRRVSVTVSWYEGKKQHNFEVMQWVTNPQQSGLLADVVDPSALGLPGSPGGLPGGSPSTTGGTGTPPIRLSPGGTR